MNEANMTNLLAEIQRENCRTLFTRHGLGHQKIAEISGFSLSSVAQTFGNTSKVAPSKRTLRAMYAMFSGLPPDCLDVANSVDEIITALNSAEFVMKALAVEKKTKVIENLPTEIVRKKVTLQFERTLIETEISEVAVKKILEILIYGEEE
jgi:hypothetical protein